MVKIIKLSFRNIRQWFNEVMNVQLTFWYLLPMLHSWTSKVGEIYERKESPFICGQPRTEHFIT